MKLARIIGLAVTCAALALGQSKPEQKPAEQPQSKTQTAKPAAASEEKEANGKNEGIKVHGHWVLEIRNPDGSVARRKEFENSLTHSTFNPNLLPGDNLLTTLLLGGAQAQNWSVSVFENAFSLEIDQAGIPCDNATGPCSNSLTVGTINNNQQIPTQIVLSGVTPASPLSFTI